uniref:Uncharacterized protein n=1 Tax=Yoonia rhodophyticola TaxID=3137370 RepID=A0AAN0ME67_9RHOB
MRLREVISSAQGGEPLRFGAWLGLRHEKAAGTSTSLLAELPAGATDLAPLIGTDVLQGLLDQLDGAARPTMIGFDGATGNSTIYCAAVATSRAILPILAEPAQVSPDVLSYAIDGLVDITPTPRLPVDNFYFSYELDADGRQPPALTIWLRAATLFQSDAAIAARIQSCGGRRLSGYAALIENNPRHPQAKPITAISGCAHVRAQHPI